MHDREKQNISSTWTILWKNIGGTPTEKSLKYLKRTIILKENINALKEFCSALKRLQQNLPREKKSFLSSTSYKTEKCLQCFITLASPLHENITRMTPMSMSDLFHPLFERAHLWKSAPKDLIKY